MKRVMPLLAVLAAMLVISCSQTSFQNSLEIETIEVPGLSFAPYHTWKFAREEEYPITNSPVLDDPAFRKSVGQHMVAEMNKLGYTKVDSDPDFVMMIHIMTEQKFDEQKMNDIYQGYDMSWAQMNSRDYWREGSLILFAIDAKTGKQIWSASARARLEKDPVKPETTKERVRKVISMMLEDFPPAGR